MLQFSYNMVRVDAHAKLDVICGLIFISRWLSFHIPPPIAWPHEADSGSSILWDFSQNMAGVLNISVRVSAASMRPWR